jgi:hypothetical protein
MDTLCGTAPTSDIHVEILERFRSKVLVHDYGHVLVVPNTVIRTDLQTPTVKKSVTTAVSTVLASAYTQTT